MVVERDRIRRSERFPSALHVLRDVERRVPSLPRSPRFRQGEEGTDMISLQEFVSVLTMGIGIGVLLHLAIDWMNGYYRKAKP